MHNMNLVEWAETESAWTDATILFTIIFQFITQPAPN